MQKALLPFEVMHKKHWLDVVDKNLASSEELMEIGVTSFKLLHSALSMILPPEERPVLSFFTLEFYFMILGMLELNDSAIYINAPLWKSYLQLESMPAEKRGPEWFALEELRMKSEEIKKMEAEQLEAELGKC